MKKLHYFPFYYLDWLSSSNVMMMTYEEKGLFIDMLCRCYNDEGLPDDNDKLQRLFKCDEHLLKSVKDMFYSVDGLLKNKKLDSICNDQSKMFTNKVNAGKASAKARADKKLQSATPVEHLLNPVATEVQQNPTNKTKQNRIEQKKEDTVWLEGADIDYLEFCEDYFNMLLAHGKIKESASWKTRRWYDAARLMVKEDKIELVHMRSALSFLSKTIDDKFCPQVWSLPSLREKWINVREFLKRKIASRPVNSNSAGGRPNA